MEELNPVKYIKHVVGGVVGLLTIAIVLSSFYTVPEGYQGVVKRFSEAKDQVGPGLHWKVPFIDSVEEIEVRTKKNTETMSVATKEQMRAAAVVSINWTVKKEAVLELFKQYGSLSQFEERMLDPKLRDIAKRSISKFTAEDNINNREQVTDMIKSEFLDAVADLPVTIESVQFEDIQLPENYLRSIDAKQTAKNERDAEKFKLEKQKLEAMRAVNTADAEKQSAQLKADGIAYKIETEAKAEAAAIILKGEAEAKAIQAKATALKNNPLIVELTKAQNWNGTLPTTVMGDGTSVLMDIRQK